MSRIVRAAMTQTLNAYAEMPERVEDLGLLADRLDAVRQANIDHHIELMEAAAQQDVQIICFGELFTGPYFALRTEEMWFGMAEDAEHGPTVTAIAEAARRLGMIAIAPIYEKTRSGRRFNTAVVINHEGRYIGKYRKTHIPHGTNEQGSFHETFYYDWSDGENGKTPFVLGDDPYFPVFDTRIGRVGISICYDRHFAGVVWSLRNQGAQLVFSPAVTFGAKSHRMWPMEFEVDAVRHNVFIGGSNRKGAEKPWNQAYFGDTHFVGPNGPQPDISQHPNLIIAALDMDELERPDPSGWNLLRDTRHVVGMRKPSISELIEGARPGDACDLTPSPGGP